MERCSKCGEDITSTQTWYLFGKPHCIKCYNSMVHEHIVKQKLNEGNGETAQD
jgi:hypothetical protein